MAGRNQKKPRRKEASPLRHKAVNALDWAATLWLGALLGWTVYGLGGILYYGRPMLASTWMAAALAFLHGLWWFLLPRNELKLNPLGFLFFPFLAYIWISNWRITPAPWLGRLEVMAAAQACLIYWVAIHNLRTARRFWTLLGIFMGAAVLCLLAALRQYFLDPDWLPMGRHTLDQYAGRASGTFGVPNHFAALMLLVFGLSAAAGLTRGLALSLRIAACYLAVLFGAGIILSISRGALFGLAALLAAAPFVVFEQWRSRWLGLAGVLCLGAVSAMLLFHTQPQIRKRFDKLAMEHGESTRIAMWKAAGDIFASRPLLGSGTGSYQVYFERHKPPRPSIAPRYAHNDYLNTLSDHGLAGFLLLFGPAGWLCWRSWRTWRALPYPCPAEDQKPFPQYDGQMEEPRRSRRRKLRHTAAAKILSGGILLGLLGFGLHMLVDFHLKIPALLFAAAILMAALVRFTSKRSWDVSRFPRAHAAGFAVWAAAGGFLLAAGRPAYQAAAHYFAGREKLNKLLSQPAKLPERAPEIRRVIARFEQAAAFDPGHAQAWGDAGLATLQLIWSSPDNTRAIAEKALGYLDKALSLSGEFWEYWVQAGIARQQLGMPEEEVRPCFRKGIELAPRSANAWYYWAFFLSADETRLEEARRAVRQALRLNPSLQVAKDLQFRLSQSRIPAGGK